MPHIIYFILKILPFPETLIASVGDADTPAVIPSQRIKAKFIRVLGRFSVISLFSLCDNERLYGICEFKRFAELKII